MKEVFWLREMISGKEFVILQARRGLYCDISNEIELHRLKYRDIFDDIKLFQIIYKDIKDEVIIFYCYI